MLGQDPYSGHVFIFRSISGDFLKILHWDGSGLLPVRQAAGDGRFVWPPIVDGAMPLTPGQMALLGRRRSTGGGQWRQRRRGLRSWSDRRLIPFN